MKFYNRLISWFAHYQNGFTPFGIPLYYHPKFICEAFDLLSNVKAELDRERYSVKKEETKQPITKAFIEERKKKYLKESGS